MATASRPLTNPRIQQALVALSLGYSGRSVKLITHLKLVRKLRMLGALPPSPIHLNSIVLRPRDNTRIYSKKFQFILLQFRFKDTVLIHRKEECYLWS
jgi:hypothetical protein